MHRIDSSLESIDEPSVEFEMKEFVFSLGLWAFFLGFIVFVSRTEAENIGNRTGQHTISELKVVEGQELVGR
jgi:hypothetical protein